MTVSPEPHPWHNSQNAFDVDADEDVAANDALLIIDLINANGSRALAAPTPGNAPPPYVDVSADNFLAPIDALLVINYVNANTASPEGESTQSPSDILTALIAADVAEQLANRRRLAAFAQAAASWLS